MTKSSLLAIINIIYFTVIMGFSEHQDNLSMQHLERQERKIVIEQKVLQETNSATKQAYKEVLLSLRPDQI